MPGYATQPVPVVGFFGARMLVPRLPVLTLGLLGVNPIVFLSPPPITVPGGKTSVTLPVPNQPSLIGGTLYWQSLVLDPNVGFKFANLFVDVIQ